MAIDTTRCGVCGRPAHLEVENPIDRLAKLVEEKWLFCLAEGKLYCPQCRLERPN